MEPTHKKQTRRKAFFVISLFGLIVIGLLVGWYRMNDTNSDASSVPKKVQQAVDFPIYYPDSLPSGYILDAGSFQLPEKGVVLFKIAYDNGKDIVFTEQQQPSAGDIDKFISDYLPLNSVLQLPLGQAKIGAYGSAPNIQTVLSLPIRNGPWLIIFAPSEVNHDDLTKIVTSLTK